MPAILGLGLLITAGCDKPSTNEPPKSTPQTERPLVTRTECQARSGTVVNDIGDGATHRPDFRCANGEPPLGTIKVEQGEPIPIEGAVCCGPALDPSQRPLVTPSECEAQGGTAVAGRGDNSIFRPEYRCANGQPPTGTITQGGFRFFEGGVCCGA